MRADSLVMRDMLGHSNIISETFHRQLSGTVYSAACKSPPHFVLHVNLLIYVVITFHS